MKNLVYIISDIDKALAFEWIATRIDRTRYRLSFVLLNPGDSALERFLTEQGIEVYRISAASKQQWPLALWRLYRFLRARRTDIVHCHLFTASILGLMAAKWAGVPQRIFTRHHSDFHYRYFPKGVRWDKLCNKLATDIVAPSGVVKDILVHRDQASASKVHIIHHGFDLDYFARVPESLKQLMRGRYNADGRSPVIGVISRFTELKGIQYIIPAFHRLLDQYPGALLLLFNARGDFAPELNRQLAETLAPEQYKTIAFEQDLAAVYSLFDVFVQVSIDKDIEAFGQTYVEALASGVPSVCTLAGIAGDFIVDGLNAMVVPYKDADAIYGAMSLLLRDDALRDKLIGNGKTVVQELFDVSAMVNGLQRLYN
jgi:glycosyltransferase involved in cell wall biosynthesis